MSVQLQPWKSPRTERGGGERVGAEGGRLWRTRRKHPADKDHQWSWPSLLWPHRSTLFHALSRVSAGRCKLDGAAGGVGRRDNDQGTVGVEMPVEPSHQLPPAQSPGSPAHPFVTELPHQGLRPQAEGGWWSVEDKREELGRGGRAGGTWSQLPYILCSRVGARTNLFPSKWGGEISSTPKVYCSPKFCFLTHKGGPDWDVRRRK